MREYMKKRYNKDLEVSRKYQNSKKVARKLNLGEESWELYQIHLADILKLQTLVGRLPKDLVDKVVSSSAVPV